MTRPTDRITLRDICEKLAIPSAKQQVVDGFVQQRRFSDSLMSTPGDERPSGKPELHVLHFTYALVYIYRNNTDIYIYVCVWVYM